MKTSACAARSKLVVNLTLSTLFEAIQWLPAQPRSPDEPSDDWKWTLRSSSNRPLLRLLQDGPLVVLSGDDHGSAPQLAARVEVSGPSREFGQGGPHHAFAVERSSAVGGHLILRANLSPQPAEGSEYMAGYQLALGPERQIRNVATVQQMTAIEGGGSQGFYDLRLRSAEAVNLGPNASMELGNEVQSVHGASETTSSLPFLNASWHDEGVRVSYRAATSPELQNAGEVADSATLAPMFSEEGGRVRIQHGLHQELRFEDNTASRRAMVAFYQDEVQNPVIGGGGWVSQQDLAAGDVLYDPVSQGFRVTGPGYTTGGISAVLAQKIVGSTWATLSYANGKALDLRGSRFRSHGRRGCAGSHPAQNGSDHRIARWQGSAHGNRLACFLPLAACEYGDAGCGVRQLRAERVSEHPDSPTGPLWSPAAQWNRSVGGRS